MTQVKIHIQRFVGLLLLLLSSWATYAQLTAQVGDTTTLSVSEVSGDTYIWELYALSEGVNFATTAGNCPVSKARFVDGQNTGNTVNVEWLEEGEYFYKVTARNACSNNVKIGRILILAAEVPPPPKLSVSYDCERGIARLTATDYTGALRWSTGGVSESIEVSESGIYTATQTLNGQQSPEAKVSVGNILAAVPTNVQATPNVIRRGTTAKLSAEGCEGGTLHWYDDADLRNEITDLNVSPEETTIYYVVCESVAGCLSESASVTVTVEVSIPNTPKIDVIYDCENSVAILTAKEYDGSLLWSTGATTVSITVTDAGDYTLVQTVAGQQSAEARVTVGNLATAAPTNAQAMPPKILRGGTSELTADGCESGTLRWYADEALTEELTDTQVSPKETTTYYVVCENEVGCKSKAVAVQVEISKFDAAQCKKLYQSITIEQFISPNGDGYNDTWELKNILEYCKECGKTAKVKLFNRWGAKVYEKDRYMLDDERFDGRSENSIDFVNSELLPDGTYFYVIEVAGEKEKTGYINLVTSR